MKPVPQTSVATGTNTVLQTLVTHPRDPAQRFNPSLVNAPIAVLWTDEREEWTWALPQLHRHAGAVCARATGPRRVQRAGRVAADGGGPASWWRACRSGAGVLSARRGE